MEKHQRRKFAPDFKVNVVFEYAKNQHTLVELAKKFDVIPIINYAGKRNCPPTCDPCLKNPTKLKSQMLAPGILYIIT